MFAWLQNSIILIISLAAFIAAVWALIDAARYSNQSFVAAGKQTKALWLVILGIAAVVAFISLPYPFGGGGGVIGFLGIAALAAVIIYFVGVKPALGQRRPPRSSGRPTSGGW